MLKLLGLVTLVIIILMSLGSANMNENTRLSNEEKQQINQTNESKEKKEFYIGDTVKMNGLLLDVIEISDYAPDNTYLKAKEGNRYVAVEVKIQNNNRSALGYGNPFYFTLKDDEGFSYNTALVGKEPTLKSDTLEQGDISRGFMTFEVPIGAKGFNLKYEPNFGLDGTVTIQLTSKPT